MKLTFKEINDVLGGKIISEAKIHKFEGVETDTRRLGEGYIFFGLKGERVDGNDLVQGAVENGAALCIVDKIGEKTEAIKDRAGIIKVDDSRKALYKLAKYYREKFEITIVGITGSTGKTSTKDILSGMLSKKLNVFKTIGNFNSDIGLPIMIFKFKDEYDVAVLEMGMSGFGEIELLADIARPDIALITNIGDSHLEQLKTRENILKAKMEITEHFGENNLLIINNNDVLLKHVQRNGFHIEKCGIESGGDFDSRIIESNHEWIKFAMNNGFYKGEEFKLNMPGSHNVSNGVLCLRVCQELGLRAEDIREGLKNIMRTSMRMDITHCIEKDMTVINDCYNASPDSMRAAIDVAVKLKGNVTAVLGTMKELGEESYNLHKSVGEFAKNRGVSKLYALGEFSQGYIDGFKGGRLFNEKEELLKALQDDRESGDIILVKASRSMRFEKIVDELLKN